MHCKAWWWAFHEKRLTHKLHVELWRNTKQLSVMRLLILKRVFVFHLITSPHRQIPTTCTLFDEHIVTRMFVTVSFHPPTMMSKIKFHAKYIQHSFHINTIALLGDGTSSFSFHFHIFLSIRLRRVLSSVADVLMTWNEKKSRFIYRFQRFFSTSANVSFFPEFCVFFSFPVDTDLFPDFGPEILLLN